MAGTFLGPGIGRLIGRGLNAYDNRHTPNPTDGGASVGGSDYGSFVNGGLGMTGTQDWGGQMPGQDMFGGYGNGSMFNQSNGPFSVPGQDQTPANPFMPAPPPAQTDGGYGLGSSGGFMGGQPAPGGKYGTGSTFGNSGLGFSQWGGTAGTRGQGTAANYAANGAMYGMNSGGMMGGLPVHTLGGFKIL